MQILEEKGLNFTEIHYLKNPLSLEQLKELSKKLNLSPGEFVRKGDIKKLDLNIELTNDKDVFQHMVKYPKIIERPIILKGNKAVIGRPPEKLMELF